MKSIIIFFKYVRIGVIRHTICYIGARTIQIDSINLSKQYQYLRMVRIKHVHKYFDKMMKKSKTTITPPTKAR